MKEIEIIVVKIGGVASDNLTPAFFQQIREWKAAGKWIVIIHGGGHYISDLMKRLGIPVEIVNGLRVTTEASLVATKMALIGQVQPSITSLLSKEGFSPVGLNAGDGQFLVGDYVNQKELGYVGEITHVKTEPIYKLLMNEFLPVIAPLAITKDGQWLNVNADTAACKIAAALNAEALYLLTDVPGVKKEDEWLTEITPNELADLIAEGVVTGGMIPKLLSAKTALNDGVTKVHITDAIQHPGTILKKEETSA